jgi:hypothetical protein
MTGSTITRNPGRREEPDRPMSSDVRTRSRVPVPPGSALRAAPQRPLAPARPGRGPAVRRDPGPATRPAQFRSAQFQSAQSRPQPVAAGRAAAVPRTPFILLVLGLLGGGLVCLLVINTTLATATFRINNLQQRNVTLSQQEQALQQQVADEQSPARIEQRALQLGMRPQRQLRFLNARTGRVYQPGRVAGLIDVPPGYVP